MKKIIRLNETDLAKLIKKVINEQPVSQFGVKKQVTVADPEKVKPPMPPSTNTQSNGSVPDPEKVKPCRGGEKGTLKSLPNNIMHLISDSGSIICSLKKQ